MAADPFKNKIRIRVNGILQKDDAILLVQLKSPVTDELVWMPPGGGLEFGESMIDCLQREFREETRSHVKVGDLLFMNELIKPPFHAVEFYFSVQQKGGRLREGSDPELSPDEQVIKDLQWIPVDELGQMKVVPGKLSSVLQKSNH